MENDVEVVNTCTIFLKNIRDSHAKTADKINKRTLYAAC